MKIFPLITFDEEPAGGTGFFFQNNETCYLVTARHNFTQMEVGVTLSIEDSDKDSHLIFDWGKMTDHIWALIIDEFPVDLTNGFDGLSGNRIALKQSGFTSEFSDKVYPVAPVFSDPKWDVAVIELSKCWPRQRGFEVFSKIEKPTEGTTLNLTGIDYGSAGSRIMNPVTTDGTVKQSVEGVSLHEDQLYFESSNNVLKEGYSGSPIYSDDGTLYGILTNSRVEEKKEQGGLRGRSSGIYPATILRDLVS